MEGKFTAHCTAFGNMEREYYEKAMKADRKYLNLYRMFHEQGVICLCNTCGEKNYCACDIVTGTSECYNCAVKRIEREERAKEQLKNFNYEDFIRL